MWIFFLSNLGMGASPIAAAVVAFSFVDPDAASLIIVVDTTITEADPDMASLILD